MGLNPEYFSIIRMAQFQKMRTAPTVFWLCFNTPAAIINNFTPPEGLSILFFSFLASIENIANIQIPLIVVMIGITICIAIGTS